MSRFLPFSLATVALIALFSLFAFGPTLVQAAPDLPPRPTLTPTATATATPIPASLARILLVAGSAYEGAWTVVQWQDEPGMWHDVDGWQGQVNNGWIRWRVAQKDWGTGPFRWQVYDKAGGTLLASTASFALPTGAYGIVWVAPTAVASE